MHFLRIKKGHFFVHCKLLGGTCPQCPLGSCFYDVEYRCNAGEKKTVVGGLFEITCSPSLITIYLYNSATITQIKTNGIQSSLRLDS